MTPELPAFVAELDALLAIPEYERDRGDDHLIAAKAESALSLIRAQAKRIAYLEWLTSSEGGGVSSRAILGHLTGIKTHGWSVNTPRDIYDFGRCYRMMERFPELRARLSEMESASDEWAALLKKWPLLTEIYLEHQGDLRAGFMDFRAAMDQGGSHG